MDAKTECAHCPAKFNTHQEYAKHIIDRHPEDLIRVKWAKDVLRPPDKDSEFEKQSRWLADECQNGWSLKHISLAVKKLLKEHKLKKSKEEVESLTDRVTELVEERESKTQVVQDVQDMTAVPDRITKEAAATILGLIASNGIFDEKLRDAATFACRVLTEPPLRLSDFLTVSQTPEFTAQILSYEVGDIHKLMAYRVRFGDSGYLGDLKIACADALITVKLLSEQFGYDPDELDEIGLERFKERMAELQ